MDGTGISLFLHPNSLTEREPETLKEVYEEVEDRQKEVLVQICIILFERFCGKISLDFSYMKSIIVGRSDWRAYKGKEMTKTGKDNKGRALFQAL